VKDYEIAYRNPYPLCAPGEIMGQANQKLQPSAERAAPFSVIPAESDRAQDQTAPAATEETNTPGLRFAMVVWFGAVLFLWALLIWDLVYALTRI